MPRTDTASRVIPEPSERVYAALVDPEALVAWMPPEGMHGSIEDFDLRPGGGYRMTLTYLDADAAYGKTTADTDVSEARFLAIGPGHRIVIAVNFVTDNPDFTGIMTSTWEVDPVDGDEDATRVTIRIKNVPSGISAADHAVGLASSLANLARYLESDDPHPRQVGTA